MTPKFRYIGPDVFYRVPAEDITEEQFERMSADQRRIVLHSGSYEPVETMTPAQLQAMKRDDFNAYARAQGIENPEAIHTKEELVDALVAGPDGADTTQDGEDE